MYNSRCQQNNIKKFYQIRYIQQKIVLSVRVHLVSSKELYIKCKLHINFWDKSQEQYTKECTSQISYGCSLGQHRRLEVSTSGQNQSQLTQPSFPFEKDHFLWEYEGNCDDHQPA